MEHTDLPWEVYENKIKSIYCPIESDESMRFPITRLGEGVNKEANAQYIVKACNNLPKVIEVLKTAIRGLYGDYPYWTKHPTTKKAAREATIEICQNLLSKLEE